MTPSTPRTLQVTAPYSGGVRPGGPAQRRDLGGVVVHKVSVGPRDNNAYLLTCRTTGSRLLVDAAAEPERLAALLAADGTGTGLDTVVTTHRHHDHHGALDAVVRATGARHLTGTADAPAIPVAADRTLDHGDTVHVGLVELAVVGLRGHTPGSVALAFREPDDGEHPGRAHLFTGDSLFPGGPGATHSPEDFTQLMTDLEQRVFGTYGDDTWVYPGHGDDTTLGAERPELPRWWARGW